VAQTTIFRAPTSRLRHVVLLICAILAVTVTILVPTQSIAGDVHDDLASARCPTYPRRQ
jgi:hypothetical protein